MERIKDKAAQAKAIAIRKLAEKDIADAKVFATIAQSLFPELEGLPQLLAFIEVLISADRRIHGEVFCVDPSANEDLIRQQCRRLAFFLQPDKAELVGSEVQIGIASKDRSLADNSMGTVYDQKPNAESITRSLPVEKTTVPVGMNNFCNFFNIKDPVSRNLHTAAHSQHPPANPGSWDHLTAHWSRPTSESLSVHGPNKFLAVCPTCNFKKVYLSIYLNTSIRCGNCCREFTPTMMQTSPSLTEKSTLATCSDPNSELGAPCSQEVDSFWTYCPSCRYVFMYSRICLNTNLGCNTCGKVFTAIEIPAPTDGLRPLCMLPLLFK